MFLSFVTVTDRWSIYALLQPLLCVATCTKYCVLHTLAGAYACAQRVMRFIVLLVDPTFGPLVSITSCCRATNGRITRCGRFKDVALDVHRVGTASLCREFVDSTAGLSVASCCSLRTDCVRACDADRCWQCKGVTNTYTSAETHIRKTSLLTHSECLMLNAM